MGLELGHVSRFWVWGLGYGPAKLVMLLLLCKDISYEL
jgi:hypothetical protein